MHDGAKLASDGQDERLLLVTRQLGNRQRPDEVLRVVGRVSSVKTAPSPGPEFTCIYMYCMKPECACD